MIAASILYLLLAGLDLEQRPSSCSMASSTATCMLAIPLFILAADLANVGSLTDRLLGFCLVLAGRFRAVPVTSMSLRTSFSPACPDPPLRTPPSAASSSG